jgi:hypothetical protein
MIVVLSFTASIGLSAMLVILPCGIGYLAHATSFGGVVEQVWLDEAIAHLKSLRRECGTSGPNSEPDDDMKETAAVLNWAIQRYNRIGPFDVAISRCDWMPFRRDTIGMNNPLVPGITLDIEVLRMPIHDGAMILVHESLHDWPPYLGHRHVTPVMNELEALHAHRPRNR